MTQDPADFETDSGVDSHPGTVHRAACHCGTVRFALRLPDGLRSARRCNCSYCRMRGAVVVSAERADVEVLQGREALTLYRFNTGEARHYFCARCGIYTFHQRRSAPDQYGVNVACIEGTSPFDFEEVPVMEGRSHTRDRPDGRSLVAGWLHYRGNPEAAAATSASGPSPAGTPHPLATGAATGRRRP